MARPRAYDHAEMVAKALELFQRQGYDAISVRDLLTHLNLSSSSLYAAFGGKEGLYLAALEAHATVEREELRRRLTAPGGIRANLASVFDALIGELIASDHATSLTLRAAVEQAASMPEVFTLLSDYVQELTHMLATLLENAHERGEIDLPFPALDLSHFLLFSAYNLGFVAKVDRSRARLEGYAAVALSVLDGAPRPVAALR